jgi:hypothetical protein
MMSAHDEAIVTHRVYFQIAASGSPPGQRDAYQKKSVSAVIFLPVRFRVRSGTIRSFSPEKPPGVLMAVAARP